ncbi:MAG: class I tRNA ligase family protein [Spirochaetales bacterium]
MQSDDFRGLVLRNTLTNRMELFSPRKRGEVRIFTCGPSVYRMPHIGNYRTFLYEDVLLRYLEYLGYDVRRTINFTDVEDKTISTAEEEGKEVIQVTTPVVERFFEESKLLGIKLPDYIPRSSTSVDEAVEIIETLIEKGHAYRHDGNVYFDPLTYEGFGEVYGLDMSRWPKKKVRFSQDTYNGQRWNLGDFILWHGAEADRLIYWDTKIGKGRPSWNVQDPAMIKQTLGFELDIHCGGIDNLWRHHDYNRAVMETAGGVEFCRYWLHGEHLIVNGEKMSKSKGNVIYPTDLKKRGCDGKHIRFLLIYGHYRDKLNVTDEIIEARCSQITELQEHVDALLSRSGDPAPSSPRMEQAAAEIVPLFEHAMNNDLHVQGAIDEVKGVVDELHKLSGGNALPASVQKSAEDGLRKIDNVLRVIFPEE